MTPTRFQKIALGIAGLTALSIGGFILVSPLAFYAGYGIDIPPGPSLLSELRAPGAGLAALGAVMLAGMLRAGWTRAGLVAALCVYLAFPAGRLVGLAVDGMPSGPVLGALAVEVAIAALCVLAFRRGIGGAVRDTGRAGVPA
ncbi:DUF4345 domain-containing protein [Rhodobacterales bacterium HKCCE2091]|nr:DUF4345 domain-containing protein [Rhodobacterales bacterium HKCCE2091]